MQDLDWIDMIRLQGLSPRQRQLCDLMWSCRDLHHVRTLIAALPTVQDQQDAQTLMELLIYESLESQGCLDQHAAAAAAVIDRMRSR